MRNRLIDASGICLVGGFSVGGGVFVLRATDLLKSNVWWFAPALLLTCAWLLDRRIIKLNQQDAQAQAAMRQRRAGTILVAGGPKNREEYLFLFPGACPRCGSRDITRHEWRIVHYTGPQGGSMCTEGASCRACGYDISMPEPGGEETYYGEYSSSVVRVTSPYASEEQTAAIPALIPIEADGVAMRFVR